MVFLQLFSLEACANFNIHVYNYVQTSMSMPSEIWNRPNVQLEELLYIIIDKIIVEKNN